MPEGSVLSRIVQGLGVRLALLLSVALLPLGLIAVAQTFGVVREAQTRSALTLTALTEHAATPERLLVERALGAAEALATISRAMRHEATGCARQLAEYVRVTGNFTHAAFIGTDGKVMCSSGTGADMREIFAEMKEDPKPHVTLSGTGGAAGPPLLLVSYPILDGPRLDGMVVIAVPHARLAQNLKGVDLQRPVDLITFNSEGEVLSAAGGANDVTPILPRNRTLKSLVNVGETTFTGRNMAGEARVFAVIPVVENEVFAIGSWSLQSRLVGSILSRVTVVLFPILMWLVSLTVAYFAVHRLVIRHVAALRARMRLFARGRRVDPTPMAPGTPFELREMAETFRRMTETIIADEARMEDMLHEKNVLLREVHHRVKNNLQLISSIINMQIRQAHSPEAAAALKQVQDRVLGLATIHRNLYTTPELSRVSFGPLLKEIFDQTVSVSASPGDGIEVEEAFDDVMLYPDQAVPLSLLAAEAATNALKYIGQPAEGSAPWVRVTLREQGGGRVFFEVANSRGTPLALQEGAAPGGLGSRLIDAFAGQLGTETHVEQTDECYRLWLEFEVSGLTVETGAES